MSIYSKCFPWKQLQLTPFHYYFIGVCSGHKFHIKLYIFIHLYKVIASFIFSSKTSFSKTSDLTSVGLVETNSSKLMKNYPYFVFHRLLISFFEDSSTIWSQAKVTKPLQLECFHYLFLHFDTIIRNTLYQLWNNFFYVISRRII